jgi:hypothetical protein
VVFVLLGRVEPLKKGMLVRVKDTPDECFCRRRRYAYGGNEEGETRARTKSGGDVKLLSWDEPGQVWDGQHGEGREEEENVVVRCVL